MPINPNATANDQPVLSQMLTELVKCRVDVIRNVGRQNGEDLLQDAAVIAIRHNHDGTNILMPGRYMRRIVHRLLNARYTANKQERSRSGPQVFTNADGAPFPDSPHDRTATEPGRNPELEAIHSQERDACRHELDEMRADKREILERTLGEEEQSQARVMTEMHLSLQQFGLLKNRAKRTLTKRTRFLTRNPRG